MSSNIASTVLKVQEKKTQKGSSYGIVKFSDLSNVFELFIFSDVFELNRDILIEGNSLMLTLIKNYTDESKTQKRINVKKMISLKEITNKSFKNITFYFGNYNEFQKLQKLSKLDGETEIKILFADGSDILSFKLQDKRKITNNLLNNLDLAQNVIIE